MQLLCTCKLPLVARKSPTFPLQTHTLFLITVLTLLLIFSCTMQLRAHETCCRETVPPAEACRLQQGGRFVGCNIRFIFRIIQIWLWVIMVDRISWPPPLFDCFHPTDVILAVLEFLVSIDKSLLLWWVACPYERQHPSASYLTSNSSGLPLLISSSLVLSFTGNSQLAGTICA